MSKVSDEEARENDGPTLLLLVLLDGPTIGDEGNPTPALVYTLKGGLR